MTAHRGGFFIPKIPHKEFLNTFPNTYQSKSSKVPNLLLSKNYLSKLARLPSCSAFILLTILTTSMNSSISLEFTHEKRHPDGYLRNIFNFCNKPQIWVRPTPYWQTLLLWQCLTWLTLIIKIIQLH